MNRLTESTFIAKKPAITVLVKTDENNLIIRSDLSININNQFELIFESSYLSKELLDELLSSLFVYATQKKSHFSQHLFFPAKFAPFTTTVYSLMKSLPFGQSLSYQELAEMAGSKQAQRAVGSICKNNPFPLFVPCHRILANKQLLGGFSAGGLDVKKELLAFESIPFIGM
ncbi:MAG: MGMT family protein [Chlamydiales bacterium]|nr:MGMT family protein [Chlamydiales bacterium]